MVKVLVLDDDEDLLEMVTMMLKANGMQVTAINAATLLEGALRNAHPDILLMDIFLGDSDGRQLCRELKDAEGYTGYPIFLYSAGEITSASIVSSDADYFLRKPFEMSNLIGQIHKQLQK